MTRLYLVVEGQTEERFVQRVLGPHLDGMGVYTTPIVVTTHRDRRTGEKIGRGGGHWKHWYKGLHRLMQERSGNDVRFSTLFDLYGLPNDFPDLERLARVADTTERARQCEEAMSAALNDPRFIPYLQRHELEALVLACLDALEIVLSEKDSLKGVARLRAEVGHLPPEDVDDGVESAPSKRLLAHVPRYDKLVHGADALVLTGLWRHGRASKQPLPRRCGACGAAVRPLASRGSVRRWRPCIPRSPTWAGAMPASSPQPQGETSRCRGWMSSSCDSSRESGKRRPSCSSAR